MEHIGGEANPWQDRVVLLQVKFEEHRVATKGMAATPPLGCPARASSQLPQAGVEVMDSSAAVPR